MNEIDIDDSTLFKRAQSQQSIQNNSQKQLSRKQSNTETEDQESTQFQNYLSKMRKSLLLFSILVILISLERVASALITYDKENTIILHIQESLGIEWSPRTEWLTIRNEQKSSTIIIALVLFHYFGTLYSINPDIYVPKLIISTYLGIYILSVLQMLYKGPRPYWTNLDIATNFCTDAFSHPNIDTFIILFNFIIYYSSFEKNYQFSIKQKIIQAILILLSISYIFSIYIVGHLYIINFILSILYTILFVFFHYVFETVIEKKIKYATTKIKNNYICYWVFLSLGLLAISLFIQTNTEHYINIKWITNVQKCFNVYEVQNYKIPSLEFIGSLHSFHQSTIIVALTSTMISISLCNKRLKIANWQIGSKWDKVKRGVILNIFLIPSWVLAFSQHIFLNTGTMQLIGLNEDTINLGHMFFVPFLINLFLPTQIYKRFGWINNEDKKLDQSNYQNMI